jgi:serine/threonine-protein kinase
MQAWLYDKGKPLGQILVEQGALGTDEHALLQALVQKHLQRHGNDPVQSLAAVSSLGSVRQQLNGIADPDLHASLAHVSVARPADEDPYATRAPAVTHAGAPAARFRILRPHARGGLGEVFVARDEELHRDVALKEIQNQHADDPHRRARFVVEAEITGGLEHPGIVPVYGLGHYADGRPFYAMRFIRGDSLQEAIDHFHQADGPERDLRERNLAFRELLGRFVDVCQAMAYAHSRGVLHRDLKPGNVMLGRYGETLVVDWGLAKPLGKVDEGESLEGPLQPISGTDSAPTQVGMAIGTPAYMSPEQAAGQLDCLGPAADTYSLGATLYCLLTGQVPFPDAEVADVLRKVQQGVFLLPRQVKAAVPAALQAVCLRAMALRPADRYATPQALAKDVERWLADESVSVFRELLSVRVRRWARRHRSLVAAAAALLMTAVVALAVGIFAVNREKNQTELARQEALGQAHEASKQRDAARAARQRTRQALDEMSSQVIEDWLAKKPQNKLEPAEKGFLDRALAYYEEFASQTGPDPDVRRGAADATWRVGKIHERLGQYPEAVAAYRRALLLLKNLMEDWPHAADLRGDLAAVSHNLGNVLGGMDRADESEAAYHEALDTYKHLRSDFPTVPEYRRRMAGTYTTFGYSLFTTGRIKEAEAAYHEAVVLLAHLAASSPKEPDYRTALARCQGNLAILFATTGRLKDAEPAFRTSLALSTQLAEEFPAVAEHRAMAGRTAMNLGNVLDETDRPLEAEAAYRKAVAVQMTLATDFPTVPDYRKVLARVQFNLGILLADRGRPKDALVAFRESLAIEARLAADFPSVPEHRLNLADSHNNLGRMLKQIGEVQDAEKAFRSALGISQQLVADFPQVPAHRQKCGESYNSLADFFFSMKRPGEAEKAWREALAIQKQLAADVPAVSDYHNDLALTLLNLAELLRDGKDLGQARRLLEQAEPHHHAALKANPQSVKYQKFFRKNRVAMTLVLAGLGDHPRAAETAAQILHLGYDPATDAYSTACALSLCVPLAAHDAELAEAPRKEQSRRYADSAMQALRRALTKGYKDLASLKTDADLNPLRTREDFKRLLNELEQGRKAGVH